MDDEKLTTLIAGCKKGRNQAYRQLVDEFSSALFGYFMRLTGNRELSEELLSETFYKVVRGIKKFKDGSFQSWIFKIASNVFYSHLRNRQKREKLIESKKTELLEAGDGVVGEIENADLLQKALESLDSQTKELLIRRYYGKLSFKEIADQMQIPIGTVLSKVHRGLKELKEIMVNENER